MKDPTEINLLSNLLSGLSAPVERLYKTAGYGLVFTVIGTFLLLISLFSEKSVVGYAIGALGSLMILIVLYFFYKRDYSKIRNLNRAVQSNKDIVDIVQKAAIEMTDLAYDFHEVVGKYSDEIADFIIQFQQTARNINRVAQLLPIPGKEKIDQLANNEYFDKARETSIMIRNATHGAEKVIVDIRLALAESNTKPLEQYLNQIVELDQKLKNIAKTINATLTEQDKTP